MVKTGMILACDAISHPGILPSSSDHQHSPRSAVGQFVCNVSDVRAVGRAS